MADLTSVAGLNLFSKAIDEIGDPDDFTESELKEKVTSYVQSSVEEQGLADQINVGELVDELNDFMSELRDGVNSKGEKVEVTSADKTNETTQTDEAAEAEKAAKEEEIKRQIQAYKTQIEENYVSIQTLSDNIKVTQEELQKEIDDAIKESEDIAEQQKEEAARITKEAIDEYIASNGQMSYDDFESGLSSKLDAFAGSANSKLSAAVKKILRAEEKMADVSAMLGRMNGYIEENQALFARIKNPTGEVTQEVKTDTEPTEKSELEQLKDDIINELLEKIGNKGGCCDPIGFKQGDTQYDFFVDKDNNGELSNENEFLGAEEQWKEMSDLDTNGDGKVTADEMTDLKLVATNADGTQEVKDASEVFKENDFINLGSYNEKNEDIGSGNTLLGEFSLNISGQEISGYNTMDDIDWLKDNYAFSDYQTQTQTEGNELTELEAQNSAYRQDFESYQELQKTLESKIETAWSNVGIQRSEIKSQLDTMNQEAVAKIKEMYPERNIFTSDETEETTEAKEEVKAEEEAKVEEEVKEEEKKKLEEEE